MQPISYEGGLPVCEMTSKTRCCEIIAQSSRYGVVVSDVCVNIQLKETGSFASSKRCAIDNRPSGTCDLRSWDCRHDAKARDRTQGSSQVVKQTFL